MRGYRSSDPHEAPKDITCILKGADFYVELKARSAEWLNKLLASSGDELEQCLSTALEPVPDCERALLQEAAGKLLQSNYFTGKNTGRNDFLRVSDNLQVKNGTEGPLYLVSYERHDDTEKQAAEVKDVAGAEKWLRRAWPVAAYGGMLKLAADKFNTIELA